MKKVVSKAEVRVEIARQIDDFLDHGGAVTSIPPGASGRDDRQSVPRTLFDQPREARTYIPEIIAAIDSRKGSKPRTVKSRIRRQQPRKKIIYDDFGEAIREVWVEGEN